MRLLISPTSHYARKVRVALIELGMADGVEIIPVDPLGEGPLLEAIRSARLQPSS